LAKHDYYETLGINKAATPDEIKKAYRKSALRYHPDRVAPEKKKESEEKFKEISEAYEILSDSNKKATYDQFGHDGLKGAFGRGGFGWQDFTHYGDFEDIFSGHLGDLLRGFGINGDLFGTGRGRSRRTGPRRGRNVEYELEIEFTEAALGAEKSVEISRYDTCSTCKGSGAKPGEKQKKCSYCNGNGKVQQEIKVMGHSLGITMSTCPKCYGEGNIIDKPCPKCTGKGRIEIAKKIKVKVPAGVDNGIRLRVSHEGDAGEKGGPRGDLYVVIYVKEHSFFKRHNNDIYCGIKISFTQAVFGAEVSVPTVDGKVKMKIPQGTQSGKVFRLRGKGVPDLLSGYGKGDQLVRVSVDVPQRLTEEQKRLLKEFAGTLGEKTPQKKGLMDKVKKAFK